VKRILAVAFGLASLLVAVQSHAVGTTLRVDSGASVVARGLPPPPALPVTSEAYQTWARVVRTARVPLDADFVPIPQATPNRVWQADWAGPVLFAPDAKSMKIPARRFSQVEGEWTVPFAKPTINCTNKWESYDGSSIWIALDGWLGTFWAHERLPDGSWHRYRSTDILQAGSESDVGCYSGGGPGNYPTTAYFWIEWAGTKDIMVIRGHRILPVKPGDTIYVKIAADTTGPEAWQRATLWFVDETTGYYLPARTFHSGCVDCGTRWQRPATLFGNTAEWIVESTFYYSPRKNAPPNSLNDFGDVELTDAVATDQDGTVYEPGNPGLAKPNLDWMTWNAKPLDDHGTLLACSSIVGSTSVTFQRAPFVIATPGDQGKLEPKPKHC